MSPNEVNGGNIRWSEWQRLVDGGSRLRTTIGVEESMNPEFEMKVAIN